MSDSSKRNIIILGIICLLLHLTIAPFIGLGAGRANLALIFVVCVALSQGPTVTMFVAFIAGLVFDLTTSGPVGLMSFELLCTALYFTLTERGRYDSLSTLFKVFTFVAFLVSLFYGTTMLFLGDSKSVLDTFIFRVLPTTLLDVVFFVPFAFVIPRLGVSGPSFSSSKHAGKQKSGSNLSFKSAKSSRRGKKGLTLAKTKKFGLVRK